MLSRAFAVSLCALSAEFAAAFTTGPLSLGHGLRRHCAAAGAAHTTWKPSLRMSGDDRDQDFVMHRVESRLSVEPMALTVAFFEHAFVSASAEIPADHLEASLSAPPAPWHDGQAPSDPESPAMRVDQQFQATPPASGPAPAHDPSILHPTSEHMLGTTTISRGQAPGLGSVEDAASILQRTSQMEQEVGPVTEVQGQVQKWSRLGFELHPSSSLLSPSSLPICSLLSPSLPVVVYWLW